MKGWKTPSGCCTAQPPRPCSTPPWAARFRPCCRRGQGAVTLDLKLTYLRPLSVKSGTISAEGKVIKLGRQISYAEGWVRDAAGNLAVHATATFSMVGEAPRAK
ncbi:MAG: Phenylacetic acid degradation-related protein [Bradyrhizobium sp.]|nr:Phenylacetic acid degradation-related protein [Bradyrhizobium sp.]